MSDAENPALDCDHCAKHHPALIARVREAEAERSHWQGELRTEILRNLRMLDVMADEAAIVIRERDELRAKITAHWHE